MSEKSKKHIKDCFITLVALLITFGISIFLQKFLTIDEHVTTIFVFAVFIVSLLTDGYFYGIAAALFAMFMVNYAFTFSFFAFNFATAENALRDSITSLSDYDSQKAKSIRDAEDKTDHYEDIIGSYLVKLSTNKLSDKESSEVSKILKIIGDYERISDHAVNILESAEELRDKGISFTDDAKDEIDRMYDATLEIVYLSHKAFTEHDLDAAGCVEPLEEIIDEFKEHLRSQHIMRLRQGNCSIEAGFVWSDLITNLERVSDHCSNIAGCVLDENALDLSLHKSIRALKSDNENYRKLYTMYSEKYLVTK